MYERPAASAIEWSPESSPLFISMSSFLLSGKHLHQLNNFNLLMSFLSGMNNSCILRLKWTKSLLSKKSLEVVFPLTQQGIQLVANSTKILDAGTVRKADVARWIIQAIPRSSCHR